jgi:hypothetical protein
MARNLKYTPERVQKITQAIRVGATYRAAAQYAGISEALFYEWKAKRVEFLEAINEAEGAATVGWLAKIEAAANEGTWQAAAWKLERRYPHEYGRQAVELTGKDGGAINVSTDLDAARRQLEERLDRLAATLGAGRGNTDADTNP